MFHTSAIILRKGDHDAKTKMEAGCEKIAKATSFLLEKILNTELMYDFSCILYFFNN